MWIPNIRVGRQAIGGCAPAAVRGNGDVSYDGEDVIIMLSGVRPAFSLKSSSVLFTSAAVGGKPDGGLTPISEYTGNEWKLTLNDSDRNGFLATLRFYSENTVRFDYKGAKTGASEYISAMVINGETIKYYGRLKNVSETGMESGNLTLTLPVAVDVEKGDRLFVFNEQCNGDCKTDYASDLLELPLKSVGSNTPRLRINAETGEWEVSYDEGQTWLSLGVKATGDKGDKGNPGQDGADGKDGAPGKDGKDGLTPFIGENGNWWIGEKDTGVKAAADVAVPEGSGNISAASPALLVIGSVAGLALLGNLGLILYIVLKKKKGLV